LLANAMVDLIMIETMSNGIKRVFEGQRRRLFPMPDFNLSNPQEVRVTLYGSILNEDYARKLIENTTLPT
jgi:ATP-dependent DNA helicase RecG